MPKFYNFFLIVACELDAFFSALISFIPGRLGNLLRRIFYKCKFRSSKNFLIGTGCKFCSPFNMTLNNSVSIGNNSYLDANGGLIEIGENVSINMNAHINASCGGLISIGDNCLIGPGVLMRTANHNFSILNKPIRNQGHNFSDIIIEDDCWIGANAIILKGVRIGSGAVIGAGSVVTKNIPSMAVAVGSPARVNHFRHKK